MTAERSRDKDSGSRFEDTDNPAIIKPKLPSFYISGNNELIDKEEEGVLSQRRRHDRDMPQPWSSPSRRR